MPFLCKFVCWCSMCREYEGTVVLLSGIICVTVTIIFGNSCNKKEIKFRYKIYHVSSTS